MFLIYFTQDGKLLIYRRKEDDLDSLPLKNLSSDSPLTIRDEVYTFSMYGSECQSKVIDDKEIPAGCYAIGLRESRDVLPYEQYRMACKGAELLYNDRQSRFCGRCGAKMKRAADGLSKKCPDCGMEQFPQVSPCVIVLIRRGKEALLVRSKAFKRNFFGLVAGFVETGETLEEAVRREVWEETSLRIKNLKYVGSQPWPFPSNLMIGFTADYAGGNLQFLDNELAEGGFFSVDNLPPLPTGDSIARKMIDRWIQEQLKR